MTKAFLAAGSIGLLLCFSASNAQAQVHDYQISNADMEIRAGLTIPFGGTAQSKNETPQLQLSLRNYTAAAAHPYSWALSPTTERDFSEHKFALTLDKDPAFLFNDREIILDDEKMMLSTTEKVLVGGAVLLVVLAVSYIEDCKDDPFC